MRVITWCSEGLEVVEHQPTKTLWLMACRLSRRLEGKAWLASRKSCKTKMKYDLIGDALETKPMGDILSLMEFNDEEEETDKSLTPTVPRGPGGPSATDVEWHNVTHMLLTAWCPACLAGRARDRPHCHARAPETTKSARGCVGVRIYGVL